jgi:hypothetical protein
MVAVIAMVGLVIDGGFAWSERRALQNAADLASLAGARVVGLHGQASPIPPAADAEVRAAVEEVLADNAGPASPCGAGVTTNCYAAEYVDAEGDGLGVTVGSGTFPPAAKGVRVAPTQEVETVFMGIVGIDEVTAATDATARAAYASAVGGPAGNLLPIAVTLDEELWNDHFCPAHLPASSCSEFELDDEGGPGGGHNGLPGQFNWMSWTGDGSTPYARTMIGPPANSPVYQVPEDSYIVIAGNTGVSNALRDNIEDWVALQTTVLLPIISPGPPDPGQTCITQPDRCWPNGTPYPPPGQGGGSHATYNVIGFAGFELTGCDNPCIRNMRGVFRVELFNGPTGSLGGTPPTPGTPLAVQLVK